MRLFVTGGSGFIGSHFLNLALREGHQPVALRRPGSSSAIPVHEGVQWVDGSLAKFEPNALEGCEALVHFAAAGVQSPTTAAWEACVSCNVTAFHMLMQRAAASGIGAYVVCGSCSEYGRSAERYDRIPACAPLEPVGAYAASKAAATMLALGFASEQRLKLSVLRPFHVYGEGEAPQRLWPSLKRAALAGEDFEMTAGDPIRDFMPVEEVARAFMDEVTVQVGRREGNTVVKNLGSGISQSIRAFAEDWWGRWGAEGKLLPGRIPYRPNEVMRYVPDLEG